nr:immunoglobulin light chain junction region [Macaca mulatta]MPN88698.1 immunoglobulin light chain junction region [Macaca mulatta]
CMQVLQTPHSV